LRAWFKYGGTQILRARHRPTRRARDNNDRQERRQHRCREHLVADSAVAIKLLQSKYLNSLIEQDHRTIKRIVWPMLGFKDFHCARQLIAGIETMHMVKKGQLDCSKGVDRDKSVPNARVKVSIWRQRQSECFSNQGLARLAARCEVNVSIGRTGLPLRGKSVPISLPACAARTEPLSSPVA